MTESPHTLSVMSKGVTCLLPHFKDKTHLCLRPGVVVQIQELDKDLLEGRDIRVRGHGDDGV